MGLFGDIKKAMGNSQSISPAAPAAPPGQAPTERAIYQSRQNFGVNFGSLFVLEKYIFDEMFIDGAGVELDAIKNYVNKNGIAETRNKMEQHWLNYCSDNDWAWLKEKGIQSVRIPIGYWIVSGGLFTKGTSFESISSVYINAWNIFKQHYIEKAKAYQISILVDLHALPKGANTGDHSGEWFNEAGFWRDNHTIDLAVSICTFIARDLKNYDNISGIQIVNESVFDNDAVGQKKYYTQAINAIRYENLDVPVVISDGWWTDQWIKFLNKSSKGNSGNLGIVIDDHIYRCFSADDKKKRVEQIINDLHHTVLNGLSEEADILIGEYSCVLDTHSWDNSKGVSRDEKVREYGNRQVEIFKDKAKAGFYFWTYKFQNGDGGEWGLCPMIDRGCIPTRNSFASLPSQQDFDAIFNEAFQNHINYWRSQNPNEKYEFWRYQEGFITAWNDAATFANFNNSRIGRIVAWKYTRRDEHIKARGNNRFLWQWDAGFQEALDRFNARCS
jgi:aryl-phospho-beta-D-glucosidase BglC (GH1 family)